MEERKILIEVTAEEYERIKAGALDKEVPTFESVKEKLLEKLSEEDAKQIVDKHTAIIVSNILDDILIGEVIKRTKNRSSSGVTKTEFYDAASDEGYVLMKGELEHLEKKDYSQWNEPVVASDDVFTWSMKLIINKR